MKTCRLCSIDKNDSEFYKGLRQCKPCYRAKVRKYRQDNIDKVRAYDRDRGNRQDKKYLAKYRRQNPVKYKAVTMVNHAIRDGRLHREPCEVCKTETRIHAHHDDYAKPLNVRWLCSAHHSQWHRDNGEAKNGS
jgi:hypothetical protein